MNKTYLELKAGKWVSCNNYYWKIAELRKIRLWKSNFELDISLDKDIKECTIFEAELLGVTTKYFFPKAEYAAIKVKNGDKELWASENRTYKKGVKGLLDGYDDYCRYCVIHKKRGVEVLKVTVVELLSTRHKCFEKKNGGWVSIEKKDYDKKIEEMTGISTVKISDPATKVQTNTQDSINTALESLKPTEKGSSTTTPPHQPES
ncbi:hypothetical protein BEWA_036360 [Theileria equi strain WA]|uniref:Uncharacterized protein n=1 Tax=Theileria equi strain WA TaxID=1537102 RepID=L1LEB8_THEEQ|nr:hypothetical protein BEWA_036360 [Theileria equi strain WA]EKX73600.1 hypothetical protein BEWA_036360 [Theileria equi strain WA]|eukprot:XP_004833052.1 hypothetical protein BEWA_036360 [Theileria equi strain WA]